MTPNAVRMGVVRKRGPSTRRLLSTGCAIALALFYPGRICAQGVQATRGVIASAEQPVAGGISREEWWAQVVRYASLVSAELSQISSTAEKASDPSLAVSAAAIQETANRIVGSNAYDETLGDDVQLLKNQITSLLAARTGLAQGQRLRQMELDADVQRLPPPPSQAFKKFPDVVFTVGYAISVAESDVVQGATISTNLLGAAIGGAFGGLGIDALKDYFVDNTATSVILPVGEAGKPSVSLGLGLGELRIKTVTVWPVLGVEQFNDGDTRIPTALIVNQPDQEQWSAPVIGISLVTGDLKKKSELLAQRGKPIFIFSFAVGLPFYYPGGALEALGALFTDKSGDYEREGHVTWGVGVTIPLLPVKPTGSQ